MVSAIAVRLNLIGFQFSSSQLFWLTAMPGFAGGSLRILHTFFIPIFGTRQTITWATLSLLLPCIGWTWAVQDPSTPYWVLLTIAFLAGLGGGNFSSFMPSTSLFFPKRLQGTALGIQAGVGNFGVSIAQLAIPWIIGFTLPFSLFDQPQVFTRGEQTSSLWVQNAAIVWIPWIFVGVALAWFGLRSVPVHASFSQQTDIFREKHTWIMTSLYIMTFGSFSGFSATFPLLIRELYGSFDKAPDPLTYAFLGPLVGSASRVAFGPLSDRFGGARVTTVSSVGLLVGAVTITFFTEPSSLDSFPYFVACMLGLFLFSGIGNASTFKQIPVIFPPRQAGGVIGWTAAAAAYGPFLFSGLISLALEATGKTTWFFYGAAGFYAANIVLNWWYYARRGAEKPC
jgi:NNP family nitrate/nitrite transporter-like MFS transporter